ncbi:MAG: dihydroorotate dehydrogenase, partial [Pirellulaceae bacterium]|nr:dihydroorotate dehydrogenase [Pirellulaceae bacterium]
MAIDLTSYYGGLVLRSPIVVGACEMTAQEQVRVALEAAGAGAIVLPSLFDEEVLRWNQRHGLTLSDEEQSFLESLGRSATRDKAMHEDADVYLSLVNRATVTNRIPIIASLNGHLATDWVDFAGQLEEVGANAIELNIHHPPPREFSGPREIEEKIIELVRRIEQSIRIPLFLKLSRNYTSVPHLACKLLSGVQGLVLYGRTPEVDIELDSLQLKSRWELTSPGSITSTINEIMQVHAYCPAMSLAASGGIADSSDVAKSLIAGADVAMVTSAIYREGPDVIRSLHDGLVNFMERKHLTSILELEKRRPLV